MRQVYAAVLQVALFTAVSTQTLEQVWFTDPNDPNYFVNGKLTLTARLSAAFIFSFFMFVCRAN